MTSMSARKSVSLQAKFARLMLQFFDDNPSPAISSFSDQQLDELFDLETKGSLKDEMFFQTLTKFQIKFQAPGIHVNSALASADRREKTKSGSALLGAPRVPRGNRVFQKPTSSSAAATGSSSGVASAAAESPSAADAAPDAATGSSSGVASAAAKSPSVASSGRRADADDARSCGQKRPMGRSEAYNAVPPKNNGGARANYQICLLDGKPNQIFDQIGNCFKNSIGLIMREINDSVYSRLQSPNLTTGDINTILNLGGYVLRKLPLFLNQHCNRLFKPEMPYLLAILLENQFEVQLPWLKIDPVDPEEALLRIRNIVASMRQMLPFLILNPFNKYGVAMHTIGLDCRFQRAMVLDPANANSFPFTLQNLNAVCDGRWTPSFRHIWVICRR